MILASRHKMELSGGLRMELHEEVEQIRSRGDLVAFISRLRADYLENPAGWENSDLPAFLEAVAAWSEDLPGFFENRGEKTPEEPTWRLIGMTLLAAKHYE